MDIPPTWKQRNVHPVYNERSLKPYVAPFFPSQILPDPDPPTLINDEEHFDVEEVLDAKFRRRGRSNTLHFFIKWLDYSAAHNSWEPFSNLDTANEKVQQFYNTHHAAPGHDTWCDLMQDHQA